MDDKDVKTLLLQVHTRRTSIFNKKQLSNNTSFRKFTNTTMKKNILHMLDDSKVKIQDMPSSC